MTIPVPFPGTPEREDEATDQVKRHQLLTRTIAILAGVACNTHRLAIQNRITQHGFSIISERLEEWSLETDQDFLMEFLRDEEKQTVWMHRLTGAPIYVMILERNRAVEMWMSLCGPDLDGAEEILDEDGLPITKCGLRAAYGAESLYGSHSTGAPRQIAICFPEFASVRAMEDLQAESETPNTYAAIDAKGGFMVREDNDIYYNEEGKAFDAHNGQLLDLQPDSANDLRSPTPNRSGDSKGFKARPLPVNRKPAIQPRLSKAAALRMGVALPAPPKRAISTSSGSNDASLGISGLPRSSIATPKVRLPFLDLCLLVLNDALNLLFLCSPSKRPRSLPV
jgi:nucleoside diphosphate kinase